MTENSKPGGLYAIGWLFLLHGLADIVVGVYRCHDVNRALTDLLAAALPRSQLCLLAMWLVVGSERFSWRICGLVAGSCFVFIVFSCLLFPGECGIGHGTVWLEQEWVYYFRLSGPGDLLVKLPILIGGIAAPLFAWRAWRAIGFIRQSGLPSAKLADRRRFQFRFQDVAIWTVALCLALAASYRTAPYPGWFEELLSRWGHMYGLQDPHAAYYTTSALPYVLVGLVSIWAVFSTTPLRFRVPLGIGLVFGPAYGFEIWLQFVAEYSLLGDRSPLWYQASAETFTCAVAAATIVGSLLLIRLHGIVYRSIAETSP